MLESLGSSVEFLVDGAVNVVGAGAAVCGILGILMVTWDFVQKLYPGNKRDTRFSRFK